MTRKPKTACKAREPANPPLMTNILTGWPGTQEYAFHFADKAAIKGSVARPGGGARGKQKKEAADEWRIPAAALAKEIWDESRDLSSATDCLRIRKFLPKDNQPPSDRALNDHIRPLKPQK
jgi:hypothetical protein